MAFKEKFRKTIDEIVGPAIAAGVVFGFGGLIMDGMYHGIHSLASSQERQKSYRCEELRKDKEVELYNALVHLPERTLEIMGGKERLRKIQSDPEVIEYKRMSREEFYSVINPFLKGAGLGVLAGIAFYLIGCCLVGNNCLETKEKKKNMIKRNVCCSPEKSSGEG